ncbi:leucine/isoleucine/valine transporter subunit; ATP-binding component of ABC superfamily [Paraburkholderia ribeironis]|uniref:Leucine/isoleucine/valine transporter subunit ATP-binding component of ABC superfamily n=1 Tax=Paraburkholderia ribeironis TaxID=1247936 RepID=A0A1N7RZR9_9BURK|nr:ABC transporter ATP-binding protein [Paraburkholderia ribeironis]SIT40576.1 leucine/isoleucine/valine transporter subunit; ATP-binding component of ABC superfamily [Paraburkholderia ribeironis]
MALLEVDQLSIRFGNVRAVQDVSFCVDEGMVYSVIGPNGAGKTTLFNLITGVYLPSAGKIRFAGKEIQGKDPYQLAHAGIARTFQNLQVWMNMTAIENVMVGAHQHLDTSFLKAVFHVPSLRRSDRLLCEQAAALMQFVGLETYVDSHASSMPYGALKRLEIARALAMKPRLLFLDEPAAGLNPRETLHIAELIRRIAQTGVTIVLVEHDMKLVMDLSDRLLVLDYGKRLAEGGGEEIRKNPDVIAAYLGGHA